MFTQPRLYACTLYLLISSLATSTTATLASEVAIVNIYSTESDTDSDTESNTEENKNYIVFIDAASIRDQGELAIIQESLVYNDEVIKFWDGYEFQDDPTSLATYTRQGIDALLRKNNKNALLDDTFISEDEYNAMITEWGKDRIFFVQQSSVARCSKDNYFDANEGDDSDDDDSDTTDDDNDDDDNDDILEDTQDHSDDNLEPVLNPPNHNISIPTAPQSRTQDNVQASLVQQPSNDHKTTNDHSLTPAAPHHNTKNNLDLSPSNEPAAIPQSRTQADILTPPLHTLSNNNTNDNDPTSVAPQRLVNHNTNDNELTLPTTPQTHTQDNTGYILLTATVAVLTFIGLFAWQKSQGKAPRTK